MVKKIRVALVGCGNCASALVQGIEGFKAGAFDFDTMNLMMDNIGGYTPENVEFVAAFDVDQRKVGKPLNVALHSLPNNTIDLYNISKLEKQFPIVQQGPRLDGVDTPVWGTDVNDSEMFVPVEQDVDANVEYFAQYLRDNQVDILMNYLPVGSQDATEFWMNVCLNANVNVVNCIPCFIASDKVWAKKFADNNVTIIGDDVRSTIGASIISAVLQECFLARGADIDVHYQDNVGGNMDFKQMQNPDRLASKKISKENVIRKQNDLVGKETKPNTIAAGPAKYFPALKDNKRAHWLIKGTIFGRAPFEFTADLSCIDSPNSAGVAIDAIRFLKVAQEIGIVGPIVGPSAATKKTPPVDMFTKDARTECEILARREIPHDYVRREDGKFVSTFIL
ncbi:inositol-1-phosphate synthase [Caulobacter phage Cr30]|uniref:inositol-1-phosphate synthase n=1 Tax=Caulobacter phage Cr30 TaxID=1357714 RepID=UPI0004A9B6BD|nr:inositol-1-phosphate synthase [Caulobacter phage Cr30]AGS81006.1 inositol-1-phosphate synthase [Caulobacter phage Cr30]